LGDMWWPKNHMGGLDIFTMLLKRDPKWRLHIRGQHEAGDYWPRMYEHYLDSRGIRDKVTLYNRVESMNDWYENIDVLLHPGMKEAYCYAVAEAMAKGIPAVVNEFMGSRDIWDDSLLYQTHEEAIQLIRGFKHFSSPKVCRHYMNKNHNVETMLQKIDELLGT
jgi:glycosyltransferase involved in cell wall biosynthesis